MYKALLFLLYNSPSHRSQAQPVYRRQPGPETDMIVTRTENLLMPREERSNH